MYFLFYKVIDRNEVEGRDFGKLLLGAVVPLNVRVELLADPICFGVRINVAEDFLAAIQQADVLEILPLRHGCYCYIMTIITIKFL